MSFDRYGDRELFESGPDSEADDDLTATETTSAGAGPGRFDQLRQALRAAVERAAAERSGTARR